MWSRVYVNGQASVHLSHRSTAASKFAAECPGGRKYWSIAVGTQQQWHHSMSLSSKWGQRLTDSWWRRTAQTCTNKHQLSSQFSRTTWKSQSQKSKTILDFNHTRNDAVIGWKTESGTCRTTCTPICTVLQIANHSNTLSLSFYELTALADARPTVSKHWK